MSSPLPSSESTSQSETGRVTKASLTFGAALIAVVLASMLPLPWSLAGLGFAVAAFITGVRAIKAIRQVPQLVAMQFLIVVGLAMTAFLCVGMAAQILLFPSFMELQTCQAQAITETAAADCAQQFRSEVTSRFPAFAAFLTQP